MAFDDLYQEIILDHYRNPRNAEPLANISDELVHENPSCGDSVKIAVDVADDGTVRRIRFDGHGCAISVASASIMSEELVGKPVEKVRAWIERFVSVMRGTAPADDLDEFGDLVALKGIIQYPTRVKCATLAWHALNASLPEHATDT
jgi:nitrogen fixation protein NifU and related proteins